jgi:membrane protein insertase Oxa1/YidC/SpoIIIJ
MAQSVGAGAGEQGRRHFSRDEHHPAVEVARHAASPLSAALMIFTVHKMWQWPMIKAWAAGRARAAHFAMTGGPRVPAAQPAAAADARLSAAALSRSRSGSGANLLRRSASRSAVDNMRPPLGTQQTRSLHRALARSLAWPREVPRVATVSGPLRRPANALLLRPALALVAPSRHSVSSSIGSICIGSIISSNLSNSDLRNIIASSSSSSSSANVKCEPGLGLSRFGALASLGDMRGAVTASAERERRRGREICAHALHWREPAATAQPVARVARAPQGLWRAGTAPTRSASLAGLGLRVRARPAAVAPQRRGLHFAISPRVAERIAELERLYEASDAAAVREQLVDLSSVHAVENFLYYLHDVQGLDWTGSILVLTLMLRIMLVPINAALLINATRMKLGMPDMIRARDKIDAAETLEAKIEADKELEQVFAERRCHPTRNWFFPLLLPPMILSVFAAVHNILLIEPATSLEGMLWFPDLAKPDNTAMLAIATNTTWLVLMESSAGVYYWHWNRLRDNVRFIAVASIPLAMGLPSGVLLFWTSSNLFSIGRVLVFRRDAVRDYFGIPRVSVINSLAWLPKPDLAQVQYEQAFYSKWSRRSAASSSMRRSSMSDSAAPAPATPSSPADEPASRQ